MREILAPRIRQACYDVGTTDEADPEEADIILCLAQSSAVEGVTNRPVVRLRNAQRPMGPEDRSIYRYDRDALIAAIEAVKSESSEEHTSELQSPMRISYAVVCLKKKNKPTSAHTHA